MRKKSLNAAGLSLWSSAPWSGSEANMRANKGGLFDALAGFLPGAQPAGTQAEVAGRLAMSEGAVKVAVHRLRQRFRQVFREEIAHTVERAEDIEEEMRQIVRADGMNRQWNVPC